MTDESLSENAKVFPLVVQQTYFNQGFFNVTVEYDHLVKQSDGSVILLLGTERRRIEGKVNRSANTNRSARVMGGADLRDWFHGNCRPGETVYVDLSALTQIKITTESPKVG